MDCLANMDFDYDEGYETVHQKVYTAINSKNECCECEKIIEKGTEYELYVGSYSCGKAAFHTCIDCLSVRNAFFHDFAFGGLWEAVEQNFEDGTFTDECIAKNLLKCTENARADIEKFIKEYSVEDKD